MNGGMVIFVENLQGKTLNFDVDSSLTVQDLRELIQAKDGIPPEEQRIIFFRKQLEDDLTLSDYNVQRGSTLHLKMTLNGGMQIFIKTLTGKTMREKSLHQLETVRQKFLKRKELKPGDRDSF